MTIMKKTYIIGKVVSMGRHDAVSIFMHFMQRYFEYAGSSNWKEIYYFPFNHKNEKNVPNRHLERHPCAEKKLLYIENTKSINKY